MSRNHGAEELPFSSRRPARCAPADCVSGFRDSATCSNSTSTPVSCFPPLTAAPWTARRGIFALPLRSSSKRRACKALAFDRVLEGRALIVNKRCDVRFTLNYLLTRPRSPVYVTPKVFTSGGLAGGRLIFLSEALSFRLACVGFRRLSRPPLGESSMQVGLAFVNADRGPA